MLTDYPIFVNFNILVDARMIYSYITFYNPSLNKSSYFDQCTDLEKKQARNTTVKFAIKSLCLKIKREPNKH